jgi:hypothetical protein
MLIVSPFGSNVGYVLNSEYREIGTIPQQLCSISVDGTGRLYDVSSGCNTNELLVLDPPYSRVSQVINFGNNFLVLGVATDPRTNVVAAAVVQQDQGPYSVVFFRRGSQTPCATIQTPVGFNYSMAFDREGTLFIMGYYPVFGSIAGQCHATTMQTSTMPQFNFNFNYRPPLLISKNDDLMMQDNYSGHVFTFAHPKNGKFSPPIATTSFNAPQANLSEPLLACLAAGGDHVWVTYLRGPNVYALFDYPGGGNPIQNVTFNNALGCATVPPVVP